MFAVDGPNSPAAEPFVNTVYKVLPAGATPSAKFPPSWIDQTMKKIEEFGEEVLAKFEEVTAKSKSVSRVDTCRVRNRRAPSFGYLVLRLHSS